MAGNRSGTTYHHSQWLTCGNSWFLLLNSVDLEILGPREGRLPSGDTARTTLNSKLWFHLVTSGSLCQETSRQWVTRVTDLVIRRKEGCWLGREECFWKPTDPLRHLLVEPCPILTVCGQVHSHGLRRAWQLGALATQACGSQSSYQVNT